MRAPDWVSRLQALMLSRLDTPFAWGSNDCLGLCCDAVQAVTGVDALAELRQPRRSAAEAYRKLRAGGGLPRAFVRLGLPPVPPPQARCGDLVAVRVARRLVYAVCNGDHAMAPGPQGLQIVGLQRAARAWKVG